MLLLPECANSLESCSWLSPVARVSNWRALESCACERQHILTELEAGAIRLARRRSHAGLEHVHHARRSESLAAARHARHGILTKRKQHRGIDANADRVVRRPLPNTRHRIASVISHLDSRVRGCTADLQTDIAEDLRVRVRLNGQCRGHGNTPEIRCQRNGLANRVHCAIGMSRTGKVFWWNPEIHTYAAHFQSTKANREISPRTRVQLAWAHPRLCRGQLHCEEADGTQSLQSSDGIFPKRRQRRPKRRHQSDRAQHRLQGYRLSLHRMPTKRLRARKTAAQRKRAAQLLGALRRRYPEARCALEASTPHELLIATILSAQATDASVNKATPALFKAFPTVAAFAAATPADMEPYVRTINFWRNKSRAIVEAARSLQQDFGGEVPRSMDALLTLRGVARKTANVVLGNAFGMQEGVVVDTHVARLSKRMRLTRHTDPVKVERDLMALFVPSSWCELSHLLISHGRAVCKARGDTCANDSICRRFCMSARGTSSAPSSRRRTIRAPA